MKNNKKFAIILAIIVLACVGGLVFKLVKASQKNETKYSLYTVSAGSDLVFNAISKTGDAQQVYNNQAYGEIEKVHVKTGQSVKKGDSLITFVNKEVEKQIDQMQLQLEQAKSQANYALEDRNSAYKSYNKLVEKYNETFSPELEMQIDQMEPTLNQSNRAYKQALDQVELQKKQLNDLKESSRKTINATISGVCKVNEKNIDNPMSQGALVEVTSDENIIEGNISEYDYNKLKENDEVEVIPINGDEKTKGTVVEISNTPESQAGSFEANQMQNMTEQSGSNSSNFVFKIKTQKPIHIGFNVQVRKKSDKIELAKDMVKEEDSKYYVFEYKDSKAVKKEVQLEKNTNSYTVISGLKSGDKIISKVKDLKDNQEIKVED
ncbi:MAG: biotin/lipoyl-binding protein [Finegoldia magna]|uniref:ABC transporter ATP-binding protein n=1 Tax=Finegoldia magna TaxID=1260 RepID=A0A233V400_FINMA|nr:MULTISPECIES: biotin/lipoyl-binding protein [Finegoldia]MBS5964523.1 biotin/lipoyl-binding protein [Finegoldia magna]MDU2897691.1 biotin/lipoyl-binding protein [Finegoldia magna]MDU4018127.1 biotin/lipoyl-binding protein [Finegoldia magna]MDU5069838.1 biotin/lipoyl-binding protein [Finegoldia magna]MDU5215599.1 biotin/lipoyl-binding protein [Finegoldia magna]